MALGAVGSQRRILGVGFMRAIVGCLVAASSIAVAGVLPASVSPASATEFNWPSGWTNPAGSASWQDWDFDGCGYVIVDGEPWAHLGNDSQGYKSGPVRSIGAGVVKRAIDDPAPDNGLMVEYQSSTGPFTLSYQHVTPSVGVGTSVVAGQQIGTVANWADTSNNHVHVSLIPGAYSTSTSWYGYRNCATGAGSGGGHVNPIPWLTSHGPAGEGGRGALAVSDGHLFVAARTTNGRIAYRARSESTNKWGSWHSLDAMPSTGTLFEGDPALAVSDGVLFVAARTTHGRIAYRARSESTNKWGSWHSLDAMPSTGTLFEGDPALAVSDGVLFVAARTTNGRIAYRARSESTNEWGSWHSLGTMPSGTPFARVGQSSRTCRGCRVGKAQ